ncbi:lipoyl protein ligase domain-containing protein [Roseibium aggregatum]|uniref:lipoyl protein ligase domain-containing protein n=1 Tax=Roseibium aggregatum TaxID=187304 RepID=UPI0025AC2799|nr:hypothetical protein [Roseibium aggregatum]WJS05682.1 hypothetical protein QUB73_28580 [Roseibium aggregatum]
MTGALHILPDAAAGLKQEALLFAAPEPGVLLWTSTSTTIVCPEAYRRRRGFEAAAARSSARGWPVVLRRTGGGAVPQYRGCVNLAMSFTIAADFTIEQGYRFLTQAIRDCVNHENLSLETGATSGSFCDGTWNLSVSGRKIVGTAQRWRSLGDGKVRILAHALILAQGRVEPGADAVAAFHHDLGLAPILAHAHTSLEREAGWGRSDLKAFPVRLETAARRAIAILGKSPDVQAVA